MDEVEDIKYEIEESEALTDWANEPSVKDLKLNYTDAKTSHDNHVSNVTLWLDNLNVTGSAKRKKETNKSSITPKLIRKQAEWRYSALSEPFLSSDDVFDTSPETWEDKEAAIQAGLILNHQFNTKIKKVAFVDEYVRTAVDEGTVIARVGWEFEEEEVEVEVPDIAEIPITDPARYQELVAQGIKPVDEIELGSHIELQMKTIKNHPTVEICDYNAVIMDPTCKGDIDKANFIGFRFETCMSELEKEGEKYSNLDKINLTNASVLADPDNTEDDDAFTFKDKPRKKFNAYEYWGFWDIDGTGIVKPIVATWVNNTMIRLEENPFPDKKLPFVVVQYLPVRKKNYGQPDGHLLEENQQIIGATTRGMIDIMGRSANGQMGIRKDVLDAPNKKKFDAGMDYEFNPNTNPRDAFFTHTFSPMPDSAKFMLEQQHADAESLTGVKAFHSGITGAALGNTATGVRSALDATSKRELGILRRLAEGVKEIGRKIMAMNSEFLSEEEVVRITNEEFVTIRRDDLAGKYDIRLTISTAESDNDKAEQLAFMLQTTGNGMDPQLQQIILSDIARLRKMPALAKQIKEYQPQPDPVEQKKAELEVALLEAQVRNENAKGMENEVDVGLKQAKTQTEIAKGRNLNSKSDQQDLDFLERDSGVDHQKEIEKKDHDLKSQLDLKAADLMFAADKQVNQSAASQQ